MKATENDPEELDGTLTIRIALYYKTRIKELAARRHVTVGDMLREYVRSQVNGTENRLDVRGK